MSNYRIDIKKLDNILDKTVEAIRTGKEDIYEIVENARRDITSLQNELNVLKEKVNELIEYEDILEMKLKEKKRNLMVINKYHNRYTQEDFKRAYEEADSVYVELAIKREQEQFIIKRRNELEIRIRNTNTTVEKAEKLHAHIDVALNYLTGDFQELAFKIDNIQQKQLIGLRVIQAQEEERQRIARDIHDGPAQSMSNVVLKAEICEKLISVDMDKTRLELHRLKEIVRESIQDIRKIIYDLRPMSLDDLGLIPTLQRLIHNFEEDTGIKISFKYIGLFEDIRPPISHSLFRIVQEALSNVAKHADAKNVFVNMDAQVDKIRLYIYDDGNGFNPNETNKNDENGNENSGFGILNMNERVELLGGQFVITSEDGRGTRINICIPLMKDEGETSE